MTGAGSPPPEDSSIRPWRHRGSSAGPDLHLFRVRFDELEHPRTGRPLRALVLETPDWANIVAVTRDRRMVLVRQYRFGSRSVTLEIPGGVVEKGEAPLAAATRELREETGYRAQRWTYLGAVQPNPAFHDNLCHHFLAEEAEREGDPRLDPGEDLEVVLLDPVEVTRRIRAGEIQNSLVVAAIARAFDLREPEDPR